MLETRISFGLYLLTKPVEGIDSDAVIPAIFGSIDSVETYVSEFAKLQSHVSLTKKHKSPSDMSESGGISGAP